MRTKIANQLRGILAEYGLVFKQGLSHLRKGVTAHYDRMNENGLTEKLKSLLENQYNLLLVLDAQIDVYTLEIEKLANAHEICQKVQKVEGIGPITAVALAAAIGNPNDFKNSRHFVAYLGLVPKQHSSGGRIKLLGISKRGDGYLRKLLIHGARSVLVRADQKSDSKNRWLVNLNQRAGKNRTCVALANKNFKRVSECVVSA